MSRHANLISSMSELYHLLVQLAVIDATLLVTPDDAIIKIFSRKAALEAGYTSEAVNLMSKLPYLAVGDITWGEPELKRSTVPVDYYCRDNTGHFQALRWMDDDLENEDNMIPGHSIKMTEHENYGYSLIYNTETCLMTSWQPSANPPDVQGYAHLPTWLPSEILEPWIVSFRSLSVLKTPLFMLWEPRTQQDAQSPEDYTDRDALHWRAERAVDRALWGIADVYMQCGWEVSSQEQQNGFDRHEFVTRRTRHLQEAVRPVIDRIGEKGRRYRESHHGYDPRLPDYRMMLYKAIHEDEGCLTDLEPYEDTHEPLVQPRLDISVK
ncbi:hypothetical protein N0V93_002590 [Gnomoniopsis smithogilvyi]|uniref:Uncharacterized protein n=1 Tax=Gnomoniopsis smithogilvyi TaxID=1191159 RepID=A0A9W8YZ50_9PEZI|nr:hypothetical protein N0V93_002590 [Gnomoniopsis smithogilvyi]